MREFFITLLKDLKRLTGVKQYEEIASISEKDTAQAELDALVNELLAESVRFGYIPEVDQKRIIKMAVIDAEEFYGISPRFVYKALNRVSSKYWKEAGHQETNELIARKSNAVPLSECSPEVQKQVKEFMHALGSGSIRPVPHVTEREISKIKSDDENRIKPMAKSIGRQLDPERVERMDRLMRAVKDRGLHLCDFRDLKEFIIEDKTVRARTEEEAQEIFNEVYKPTTNENN